MDKACDNQEFLQRQIIGQDGGRFFVSHSLYVPHTTPLYVRHTNSFQVRIMNSSSFVTRIKTKLFFVFVKQTYELWVVHDCAQTAAPTPTPAQKSKPNPSQPHLDMNNTAGLSSVRLVSKRVGTTRVEYLKTCRHKACRVSQNV
jgi:hypothetical protein